MPQAGGFTITSPPSTCLSQRRSTSPSPTQEADQIPTEQPYLELAIQNSSNPPAAFFHRPTPSILHTELLVRVGGRFIYPPPTLDYRACGSLQRAVFIAGGVGVNPVMSMISAMSGLGTGRVGGLPRHVTVLYGTKRGRDASGRAEKVLFEERLRSIAEMWEGHPETQVRVVMFETGGFERGQGPNQPEQQAGTDDHTSSESEKRDNIDVKTDEVAPGWHRVYRRISHRDLLLAIGPEEERANSVAYVCGPPAMTDEFVDVLRQARGMDEKRVLCEKWW